MRRINQLLTIVIVIVFATAGWYLLVQTVIMRQKLPAGGVPPDFRRVGALQELEPEPTLPPLLERDPIRTDRSDGGDTIALKLTTNIPENHQFAGGEVFTVRVLATPKYRGQLNNMLHLEGIRIPIRYNKTFLKLMVLPSGPDGRVVLDQTDMSQDCSFYELAEPGVFLMGNIDSFNSFYFYKKFPRSDPRYADPTKGIQLQPDTCIGEIKFQVIRREQIDPAQLASPFIDAQVMIPNVAREIGVDGRGPEGTFPDGTLIGNIDLNEHLEWMISNGQVVGSFALGDHLIAAQGANPTSNVPTSTTAPGVPTNTRAPTPTTGGGGGGPTPTSLPTPTGGSTPTPIGGGGPTPTANPTLRIYDKEAESYSQLVEPMVTVTDDLVSNCVYLTDPTGWTQGGGGVARYDFSIASTDIFWIWGRVKGTGWNNNSFFVRIDDGTDIQMEIQPTNGQWDWHWQPVMESSAVYLTAGQHVIRFVGRETNSGVDRIALVNRPPSQYTPNQFTTCGSATPTPTLTPPTTTFSCADVTEIPRDECDALVNLYDSTGGDTWNIRTGWKLAETPCSWYGILCSNSTIKNVIAINLGANNLTGQIPSSIEKLTKIEELNLFENKLTNSIPSTIGNVGLLKRLSLTSNQLTGSIPTTIENLTKLEYLLLDNNQLSGSIPTQITMLTNLRSLVLSHNNLIGVVPDGLNNLANIVNFSIGYNRIGGAIPRSIGYLSNLQILNLHSNTIAGEIPEEFAFLTRLSQLTIRSNYLTGVQSQTVCPILARAEPNWWSTQTPPMGVDPCEGYISAGTPTPTPTDSRPPLQPVAALVEDTPTPTPYYIDLPPQNAQWPLLWLDREGEHIYTVPINYDKPQVNEMSPDLTVVSMGLYSDPEVATCTIELETKIKNNGQSAATAFNVRANSQSYRVLTGLAPGQELTLRFSDYTHGTLMQPNVVRVDSDGEVPELREDNNILSRYLFLGSILKPECQNVTPPPAGSPTPGSITSIPLDMRKVNLRLKVKIQGVRQETFARQYARLRFAVAVGKPTGERTEYARSDFIHLGSGVYEGLVTYDPVDVPRGTNYKIIVKGPKHLAKRFCSAQASGDDYYCPENAGGVVLNIGVQDLDYSTVPMSPGDLPLGDQDGIVDSSDLSFIRENLPSKDASTLRIGDLNLDGIIDTQDFSLVINSLVNNEDER